ncbi:MAG: aldehyde dehydrogenase family protein [Anaerolineae bacterium]|nr:aldehyde dehydrogenase family protein [Anaerolineae bacterium]
MDADTLSKKINRLRVTFRSGKTLALEWRRSQLLAMQRMFQEHAAAFEDALRADLNKCGFESYATETGFLQHEIVYALAHVKKWTDSRAVATPIFLLPASSRVMFEPLGVALIMGAWNYPLQLTLGPLVAAIAAGNAAVIKPPRTAKAVFQAIGTILPQYLDEETFLVIDDDTPNDLILEQRFDKIFFTGSAATGQVVMQAAARHLTPVTLELGGKSPAIVEKSANLRVAAMRIVQGKFFNAGQTCVAPDYVLAQASVSEALIAELVKAVHEFYGTDAHQSCEFARIINTKQFDALLPLLADGEVVCGGETRRDELFIAPTILKNVSPQAPVMQREIFGPILPVLTVPDMDEALAFVQQREKPLAFYFFSENRDWVDRVLTHSSSGGVCINDTINHLVVPGLPFGGVGQSGMGKYHGEWGFREFSNARAVLEHATSFDPALRYPPYDEAKINQMKKLMEMSFPALFERPLGWLLSRWGDKILGLIR